MLDEIAGTFPSELNPINGLELADYFEGTLDPAATVRALSDAALGQLADALYRHLDTSQPVLRRPHLVRARRRGTAEPASARTPTSPRKTNLPRSRPSA